jgi:hypothetical protein
MSFNRGSTVDVPGNLIRRQGISEALGEALQVGRRG